MTDIKNFMIILIEFCQENALVIVNTLFNNTREDSTYGHANTEKNM